MRGRGAGSVLMLCDPRAGGRRLTLVGALSWEGLQAPFSLEGAMNGHAFLFYVENLLAPSLRPGQTVLMDNLMYTASKRPSKRSGLGCSTFHPTPPSFHPSSYAGPRSKPIYGPQARAHT